MKKVLSLLLVGLLAFTFLGLETNPVKADVAAVTHEAADYDTTLDEMVAVRFDSASGLDSWANQYTAMAVEATSDGGYIVGSQTVTDGWTVAKGQLVKFNASFGVDWTLSLEDGWTYINALLEDSSGNVWVFTNEEVLNDNGTPEDDTDDFYNYPRVLLKLDGTDQSELGRFDSSADEAVWNTTQWQSNSLVELSDGNILLVSTQGDDVFYEIINPTTMTLVASGLLGSSTSDKATSIKAVADPTNGFYLTMGFGAADQNMPSGITAMIGNRDIVVVKYDNAGAEQWAKQLGSTGGWNAGFAVSYYDGSLYVAGEQYGTADLDFAGQTNQGDTDGALLKLDATDGSLQWARLFGGSGTDRFNDLFVNADGVHVGGFTNSTDGDLTNITGPAGGSLVVKYDLTGALKAAAIHTPRYDDGANNNEIYDVDMLPGGEMVYSAKMGYWVNLNGNVNETDATHGFTNNSYNFDNPLEIGTWGKWAAGSAVVKIGVDTTAPVIEASPYLVVPVGYDGPLFDAVSDDFAHPLRMEPGYTGTVDFGVAGEYSITLTAEDYAGNEGTLARTIVVYDDLDGEMVNSETISATLPKVVLMKDAEYTCGMAGVSVTLTNNTLNADCTTPDTASLGDKMVDYVLSNDDYVIMLQRPLEVILSVLAVNDGDEVYSEQEVRVPFGYTVTVDGTAVNDKDIISVPGVHTVVINDGTADSTITFEILEIAQGVKDGGFYANSTTITFDDTNYTATLNGNPFTSGTVVDTWGHYVFELTEIADPLNVIPMSFVVGDPNFEDLFEHVVIEDVTYMPDGNLTRLNGSSMTSDDGIIVVGDQDGAMYVAKYDSLGVLVFEATMDSTGDDTLIDVVEISPNRYAAIGFIDALDGDFAQTSLNNYPNGEENWYNYRVLVDIVWDGTSVSFDAFNGDSITTGLVNGNANYMGQAQIEYDSIDNVLYISHVSDQWSFPSAGGYGSHDLYVAQYTVDAEGFAFGWYTIHGSTGWDRIGRMNGYGAPLVVVPGEGIVTGYSSKQQDGTVVTDADKLLASATPWYDDGEGGEYETAVIIKIDNTGATSWIKTMAGNDTVFFLDVEVDAAGNIYVAGSHETNVEPDVWAPYGDFDESVDNASTDYTGQSDLWVAKLDSAGETIWLEVAGTEGGDELKNIELDENGNVYIVGYTDGEKQVGGDLHVEPRLDNTRTLVAKIDAEGRLISLYTYNSEEFSIFNSLVVTGVDEIVAFGYLKVDETFKQSQTDFIISSDIEGMTKFVGFGVTLSFGVDVNPPTVVSVPEIVVEEGNGTLALINDIADTIFEELVLEFNDAEDAAHLLSYEITGTVDFDTPGQYTLQFVAYDVRMNPSVSTALNVHVVAENSNEDGTISVGGISIDVLDMGDAELDLDNDNSAFVYDAGTVTITGETFDKFVYDLNETMFDITTPGVYNIVEVFSNENYFVLLDREIKLLGGLVGIEDGMTYDMAVTGNFAGTATLNGMPYVSGTEITEAGHHEIVLVEFEGAVPITVNFTITSGVDLVNFETYSRTTTPVFRGEGMLNGMPFTSGTDILTPGSYTLEITGVGGYSETYMFWLTSGANVESGQVFDDATAITFRGEATLNGEEFVSGTEITMPGEYQIVITGINDYMETISFTVTSGVSGLPDTEEVDSGTTVTVRYQIGTATVSIDGADATELVSGTRFSDDGLYVITISGVSIYQEVYTFRIGEEPITSCPIGQEIVDNECVAITCPVGQELDGNDCVAITCSTGEELQGNDCEPIVCAEGEELQGNDCVEVSSSNTGLIVGGAILVGVLSVLGGVMFFIKRK